MSHWAEVFLGVIAFATLTTSIVLIALLVAAGRLARRVEHLVEKIDREITPAFGHLNDIARDAARAASLATLQVERVDRLFGDLGQAVDQTVGVVQGILSGPLRQGGVLSSAMSAFWAVLSVVRRARSGRGRSGRDDEDALFI